MIFTPSEQQKAVQFVDVGALAGAEAQMVQADAILLERTSRMLRRRRADPDCGTSADTVVSCIGIDHRSQPEKWQQLAVEFTGAFEIRRGQKNMRDAVDFHLFPPFFRQKRFG